MNIINGSQIYRAFTVAIDRLGFNDNANKRDYKIYLLEAKILRSLLSNYSHMSLKEIRLNIDIMNRALLEKATPEVIEYLKKPRALSFKEMNNLLRSPWSKELKAEIEDIEGAKDILDSRGVISNEGVESAKRLRRELKNALPVIQGVPEELEGEFISALAIDEGAELLKAVIDSGEGLGFGYTLADLYAWAGAVAWLSSNPKEAELLLDTGAQILQKIRASREVLSDLIIEELEQYTDHSTDELKEWLQDERSLDNNETDLIPLLEEYFYHEEGVYPEHMSYAVDAVNQGICPNIFEAVEWIQSNMIGIYESTADYAQHVLDEMDNPDNLPLIKAEDYWGKELRYDISVLENDSIKLLLVRS